VKVLIAGGGIGGLALALSLEKNGVDFVVVESAQEIRPLGVGINVLPHAIAEMEPLGIVPELEKVGVRTRRLRYMNRFGQEILSEARGMYAGHSRPQLSIHRGKLHAVLLAAVLERKGSAAVVLGHQCEEFEQDESGVTAYFRRADGTRVTMRGDALIGADGIHSAVRAQLHPDAPGMCWNGIMMWRGTVDWPTFEGGDTMIVAGDMKEKLLYYPILQGSKPGTMLTNWVLSCKISDGSIPPPNRENWSRHGRLPDVLPYAEKFRLASMDMAALFETTSVFFEYPMCDREPLPAWGQGRVTLLGDAAHPMYPVGSNGAAQAIIDGKRLGEMLAANPVEEALQRYEAERVPATSAIVLSNRKGGPERVVDVVSERAPDGFEHIDDVISRDELMAISGSYATMAGYGIVNRTT
jgi:2-polyprenyl-6-methoxyphenol hydroxylase-like FAD-dependent oxidoreductase